MPNLIGNGNRLNGFCLSLPNVTGLKPGVNETARVASEVKDHRSRKSIFDEAEFDLTAGLYINSARAGATRNWQGT